MPTYVFHLFTVFAGELLDVLAAEVRCHDDDGVFEIDGAPLAIGHAAIFEQLQQRVEHVGVGLLDFVEQHHGVRPAAHRFGQLPAFIVADVARRGADQPRYRMFFHVLRHVEADDRLLVVEEKLGQRPAKFGLTDAGGAEKDKRADGPVADPASRRGRGARRWTPR